MDRSSRRAHLPFNRHPFSCIRISILIFLLSVASSFPATAEASGPLADREVLPNGLVLLHAERKNLPIVQIQLAIGAGQLAEPRGKAGLARLTASLLREGTTSMRSEEIGEAIDFIGGSLGASSGPEYVTITLSILKKDLDLGFSLLADITRNPVFAEPEIARKKIQMRAAMAARKENPGEIAETAFSKELFGDHPWAFPSEGAEDTVSGITRADLQEFHRLYYVPNNAWMAVVGDVGKEEIHKLIDRYMGDWSPGEVSRERVKEPVGLTETRTVAIDKKITQANIRLGHIGLPRSHPDYYKALVMNYILGGGGFASRLMDNIRDNLGLAYGVHSGFDPRRDTGIFMVELETKNESAGRAIEEVLHEIRRIREEPVSDAELSDAKSYITGSFPLRMDSNAKLAGLLVSVEHFGLGMNYVDDYLRAVGGVTKEDVMETARKYLHPDRYLLVVVADTAKAGMGKADEAGSP